MTQAVVREVEVRPKSKRSAEEKRKASDLIRKAMEADAKLVTGVFKNLEAPGGDLEFAYRGYKDEPIRVYHFNDGETYTIPLGVAKHLNNTTKVKRHKYLVDSQGKRIVDGTPRQRYQFLSTEYM